jgi:hypothetical protein
VSVVWTFRELGVDCDGIAVLSSQGLVVVSASEANQFTILRLADGIAVSSAPCIGPVFLCADQVSATVYASSGTAVVSFHWNGDALVSNGVVPNTCFGDTNWRPLVVVPPASGDSASFLVVGTFGTPTLLVLSLPDHRFIHTHELSGFQVTGLAADPHGTSLAVCDRVTTAVHVLPWPLSGMLK